MRLRHRIPGAFPGACLLLYSALGLWAVEHKYLGGSVSQMCEAGLCPDEFSVERIFALQQKTGAEAQNLLSQFSRALIDNSASAYRWADLCEQEERTKQLEKASYCFKQALQAAPRNPVILFRAANYDFRTGQEDDLLGDLRLILRDPALAKYYDTVYLTYSRLSVPFTQVLDEGIPQSATPADGFLHFLAARNQLNEAKQTWAWMRAHHLAGETSAGEMVQLLLSNKEDDVAVDTWDTFVAAKEDAGYRHTNWLFNGSFEKPFRPSPLDWKMDPDSNVRVERTAEQAGDGNWSAELTFLGKDNEIYRGLNQLAVAHPGKWRLSAQVKTEAMTSDEGAALHVFDVWQPQQLDVWSTSVTGTQQWTPIQVTFEVKPGTKLLRVDLGRKSSLNPDSKISGLAWFDSVVLRPMN